MDRARFMKIGEVARRYGVTPDAVRGWVRNGHLEAFRTGGRGIWLISLESLQRFEDRK
jgi:excisionase family DNA binding protein